MLKEKIATSVNSIEKFDQDLASSLAGLYLPVIETYHRASYEGLENIPSDGPFVAVGNHGGVHFMPEALLWVTKYRAQKRPVPMLVLTNKKLHNISRRLKLPINELGFIDESPESTLMALESGFAIATYPGGDQDLSKAYADRHTIDFFGNIGYARAAIASQKPILPVVGCGGGETVFTVNSGQVVAEKFKLDRIFGIKSWPVFWSLPRGLHTGHKPHFSIPAPSKIKLSVLPAISVSEFEPKDADNPDIVKKLDAKVRSAMQSELDKLAKGRIPVLG